jgi:DNA repair protein RecN (Recombination protein N)
MLKSLFIQSYVLIDNLDIRFNKGLSVITGETGAGKSIILGALSLALGQRVDGKSIRTGADKCVIEALFDIAAYRLSPFFEENHIEYDAGNCILRRELFASGKSRAFVNDSPVSLTVLKELGNLLIDIHSQHQNLLLGNTRFQLRVVDLMAQNDELLQTYRAGYTRYQSFRKELNALIEKARQTKQEEDYIRFQLKELTETRLKPGEQDELEQEQQALSHAGDIKTSLYRIDELLQGEGRNGVQLLKDALATADALKSYYPKAEEIAGRLRTVYIDIADIASETGTLKEGIEFNPERLNEVNGRLNTLYDLQQKHRVSTVDELIAIRERYGEQLKEIESFDEEVSALQAQVDTSHKELLRLASSLRDRRRSASETIAGRLVDMIAPLGMPHTRFEVVMTEKEEPGADGMDDVNFYFSAHKSGELQPVSQTASGGEISRLMLCVKAMIAGSMALPAIIFDEVDMGVSGDIADKMGEIMQSLSRNMQVITITHLPQIASKGQTHYLVYKEDTAENTITAIKQLNEEERTCEVARMLSGATLTEASIANARELLRTT